MTWFGESKDVWRERLKESPEVRYARRRESVLRKRYTQNTYHVWLYERGREWVPQFMESWGPDGVRTKPPMQVGWEEARPGHVVIMRRGKPVAECWT